jgi:hypothetical protein
LIASLACFFLSGNGHRDGASADDGEKRLLNGIINPEALDDWISEP